MGELPLVCMYVQCMYVCIRKLITREFLQPKQSRVRAVGLTKKMSLDVTHGSSVLPVSDLMLLFVLTEHVTHSACIVL